MLNCQLLGGAFYPKLEIFGLKITKRRRRTIIQLFSFSQQQPLSNVNIMLLAPLKSTDKHMMAGAKTLCVLYLLLTILSANAHAQQITCNR